MDKLAIALSLLELAVRTYPSMSKAVKELLESLKSGGAEDITQEEFEQRIDAAIVKLPPWE